MKRTGQLNRKTPLSARKPMQKARRKPSKAAQKDTRWRSEAYLAWVRSLPCAFCGMGPSDAHHVIGLGWGLSGMGLKAPCSFSMPLCRCHHRAVHDEPNLQTAQPQWLRWTLAKGLVEFGGDTREELRKAMAFIDERESV
jgi:hypothetical protein